MKKLFIIVILGLNLTVFSQDSTNIFDYNYKKGIEHYNKGIDILNAHAKLMEGDVWSDSLPKKAKEEFNFALPFLEKTYSINPKDEKVLTALQGVYFSLYDFEKSARYKQELELLKKKK